MLCAARSASDTTSQVTNNEASSKDSSLGIYYVWNQYKCKPAAVTANCEAIAPGPACGTGAETGNGANNECSSLRNQYDDYKMEQNDIREVTFTFESYTNKVYSHISPSPPPPSFPPSFPPSIPPGPSSPPPPPKPPPSPWYQAKTCDEMCNWSQLQTPPLNSVNQLCVKQQWLMDPYAEVRTPGEFNSHDCKLPAIGAAQTCPSSYFICTGNKFYSAPSPPPAGTPSCPEDEETIKKCGACSNQDDCGKSEYCLKKVAKNKCKKKKVQKKCGYTCRAEIARRETEKAQRKAARAARRAQKAAEKAAKKAAKQG